jgi:hypothetical protein
LVIQCSWGGITLVKIGFIVEGDSEKILISSKEFRDFLKTLDIELIEAGVINVIGKNNLFHPTGDFTNIRPKVDSWVRVLQDKGAQVIFILLDLENDEPCITNFKPKVYRRPENIVIVAKKSLEAWYLSDTITLSSYLRTNIPPIVNPEEIPNPFQYFKDLRIQYHNRGINDKKILTRDMLRLGFTLTNAANHPNCNSARYFLEKLQSLTKIKLPATS